jgi:ribokinase
MILVFGSLNIDFAMRVERLPVLGETVLGGDYIIVPGGKGANQACAAARAGGPGVAMAGAVGDDAWGRMVTASLAEAGCAVDLVAVTDAPTGCASIWVDATGANAIAVASGANLRARADAVPDRLLGPDTWLVLQLEVPLEENWALVRRAKARGARTVLNTAPMAAIPEDVIGRLDFVIANEIEIAALAGAHGIPAADPVRAMRQLARTHRSTWITTLGQAGAAAVSPTGAWSVAALPVTPVDTTGAGDCFVGNLVAALAAGLVLPGALARASVAAALCCEVAGAQPSFPTAAAVTARLGDLPAGGPPL